MSAEIISFETRARLTEAPAADDQDEPFDVAAELGFAEEKHPPNAALLKALEKLTVLAQDGRLGGFILLAQDERTGYFLSELDLPDEFNRHEVHGFVGLLEALKLELCERSALAPFINLDGHVVDPYEEHAL